MKKFFPTITDTAKRKRPNSDHSHYYNDPDMPSLNLFSDQNSITNLENDVLNNLSSSYKESSKNTTNMNINMNETGPETLLRCESRTTHLTISNSNDHHEHEHEQEYENFNSENTELPRRSTAGIDANVNIKEQISVEMENSQVLNASNDNDQTINLTTNGQQILVKLEQGQNIDPTKQYNIVSYVNTNTKCGANETGVGKQSIKPMASGKQTGTTKQSKPKIPQYNSKSIKGTGAGADRTIISPPTKKPRKEYTRKKKDKNQNLSNATSAATTTTSSMQDKMNELKNLLQISQGHTSNESVENSSLESANGQNKILGSIQHVIGAAQHVEIQEQQRQAQQQVQQQVQAQAQAQAQAQVAVQQQVQQQVRNSNPQLLPNNEIQMTRDLVPLPPSHNLPSNHLHNIIITDNQGNIIQNNLENVTVVNENGEIIQGGISGISGNSRQMSHHHHNIVTSNHPGNTATPVPSVSLNGQTLIDTMQLSNQILQSTGAGSQETCGVMLQNQNFELAYPQNLIVPQITTNHNSQIISQEHLVIEDESVNITSHTHEGPGSNAAYSSPSPIAGSVVGGNLNFTPHSHHSHHSNAHMISQVQNVGQVNGASSGVMMVEAPAPRYHQTQLSQNANATLHQNACNYTTSSRKRGRLSQISQSSHNTSNIPVNMTNINSHKIYNRGTSISSNSTLNYGPQNNSCFSGRGNGSNSNGNGNQNNGMNTSQAINQNQTSNNNELSILATVPVPNNQTENVNLNTVNCLTDQSKNVTQNGGLAVSNSQSGTSISNQNSNQNQNTSGNILPQFSLQQTPLPITLTDEQIQMVLNSNIKIKIQQPGYVLTESRSTQTGEDEMNE